MQGLARARDVGFLQWQEPGCTFNVAEYDFYEQVENGDLNWIVPGTALHPCPILVRTPASAASQNLPEPCMQLG